MGRRRRDSADSYEAEYAKSRRGNRGKRKFDDEDTFLKRRRGARPRLAPADADDAADGLPEGDRWSTWDQTQQPSRPNGRTVDTGAEGVSRA